MLETLQRPGQAVQERIIDARDDTDSCMVEDSLSEQPIEESASREINELLGLSERPDRYNPSFNDSAIETDINNDTLPSWLEKAVKGKKREDYILSSSQRSMDDSTITSEITSPSTQAMTHATIETKKRRSFIRLPSIRRSRSTRVRKSGPFEADVKKYWSKDFWNDLEDKNARSNWLPPGVNDRYTPDTLADSTIKVKTRNKVQEVFGGQVGIKTSSKGRESKNNVSFLRPADAAMAALREGNASPPTDPTKIFPASILYSDDAMGPQDASSGCVTPSSQEERKLATKVKAGKTGIEVSTANTSRGSLPRKDDLDRSDRSHRDVSSQAGQNPGLEASTASINRGSLLGNDDLDRSHRDMMSTESTSGRPYPASQLHMKVADKASHRTAYPGFAGKSNRGALNNASTGSSARKFQTGRKGRFPLLPGTLRNGRTRAAPTDIFPVERKGQYDLLSTQFEKEPDVCFGVPACMGVGACFAPKVPNGQESPDFSNYNEKDLVTDPSLAVPTEPEPTNSPGGQSVPIVGLGLRACFAPKVAKDQEVPNFSASKEEDVASDPSVAKLTETKPADASPESQSASVLPEDQVEIEVEHVDVGEDAIAINSGELASNSKRKAPRGGSIIAAMGAVAGLSVIAGKSVKKMALNTSPVAKLLRKKKTGERFDDFSPLDDVLSEGPVLQESVSQVESKRETITEKANESIREEFSIEEKENEDSCSASSPQYKDANIETEEKSPEKTKISSWSCLAGGPLGMACFFGSTGEDSAEKADDADMKTTGSNRDPPQEKDQQQDNDQQQKPEKAQQQCRERQLDKILDSESTDADAMTNLFSDLEDGGTVDTRATLDHDQVDREHSSAKGGSYGFFGICHEVHDTLQESILLSDSESLRSCDSETVYSRGTFATATFFEDESVATREMVFDDSANSRGPLPLITRPPSAYKKIKRKGMYEFVNEVLDGRDEEEELGGRVKAPILLNQEEDEDDCTVGTLGDNTRDKIKDAIRLLKKHASRKGMSEREFMKSLT